MDRATEAEGGGGYGHTREERNAIMAAVRRAAPKMAEPAVRISRPGTPEPPDTVPVRQVTPSKSSRSPRIQGSRFTENDLKALEEAGFSREQALDPNLQNLPKKAFEALMKDRKARAGAYKTKAELDKAGGGEPPPSKATYLIPNQLDAAVARHANNIVGQWAAGNDALLNAAGPEMLKAVIDHLDATPGGGSKTLRAEVLKRLSK
jgi:hypothetical protein